MTDLDPWYVARDTMRSALVADLQGGPDDEVLTERPLDRFIVGILHPATTPDQGGASPEEAIPETLDAEADEPEVAGGTGADADFDPSVALSRVRYPSSMGLTFAVDVERTPVVRVEIVAARYEAEAEGSEGGEEEVRHRGRAAGRGSSWRRASQPLEPLSVDVTRPRSARTVLVEGLELHVVVRGAVRGLVSVTAVLLNTLVHTTGDKDPLCWFQSALSVTAEGGFVDRPAIRPAGVDDEDLDSYALLYRSVRNLAVGHGCAVSWEDADVVEKIHTTFVPHFDLKLSDAREGSGLGMRRLAETGDLAPIRDLIQQYRSWIEVKSSDVVRLEPGLQAIAERHMGEAQVAAARMEAGLQLLEREPSAMRAFKLMNAAMDEQRRRQDLLRTPEGATVDEREQVWRPFQMAFILLNLPGLADPAHADREIADVLWFPTGGGKTEAYLGLIAFAALLRRIRNESDGGVSVIMRYTLRLLTLQQFERAAGLICALELLRRSDLPAAHPFSLGLWVGQGATPNKVDEARKALKKIKLGQDVDEGNPMQLLRCPWCGAGLSSDDYLINREAIRLDVRCPDTECDFAPGLPVHVVDEDVYRERPSLLLATVDKFAMMAWNPEVGKLFSTDGLHSPPDLIVQDELHLISGPLGSMVGLYETAVDAACQGEARAKIVASTATIRRAKRQVRAVFDRSARQFPPPGLDADDSFFAVEAAPAHKGTRQYVGLLAPGVSQATLLVRTYAALLQAAATLDASDEVKDAYWTLLGYFNSLRVLGSAFMQVIDDVPDRLKVVAERNSQASRDIGEPRELTSRKKSVEIPTELAILGTSYPDNESPDVVLATNMISVGVDVDRLGLMAVMGQPQTTAEYIQATSRIGRRHPGLVVVMYNGARTRDLSHYENFSAYHRALYRQVEATGATPFAARARDRGLHGVLVSLARLLVEEARPESGARTVEAWSSRLRSVAELLVRRAESVAPGEGPHVEEHVERLISLWLDAAPHLTKYAGWFDTTGALLVQAGSQSPDEDLVFPPDDPPWRTLSSLRDVDAESGAFLVPSWKRS